MPNRQHLIEEVGKLDRLITTIMSEIETERAAGRDAGTVLCEMEEALAELRLARGVRLMWLNAHGEPVPTGARCRNTADLRRTACWPRAGQRVA
ncbi:MAG TPA: hypothetical protein VKA60_00925 [Blastocatellia bacterium]|nr:hypothetical protein [Blastocatellia bacterium]